MGFEILRLAILLMDKSVMRTGKRRTKKFSNAIVTGCLKLNRITNTRLQWFFFQVFSFTDKFCCSLFAWLSRKIHAKKGHILESLIYYHQVECWINYLICLYDLVIIHLLPSFLICSESLWNPPCLTYKYQVKIVGCFSIGYWMGTFYKSFCKKEKQISLKSSEYLDIYMLDFSSMQNTYFSSRKSNSMLQEKKARHFIFFLLTLLSRRALVWPREELSGNNH